MFQGFLLPRGPRSSSKQWARANVRAVQAPQEIARKVTVRLAEPRDERELRLLAALDSTRLPSGELLVGEMGGAVQAAVPVAGGRAIANPFVRTAELVNLLELRAKQLREQGFASSDAARILSFPRRRPFLAGRVA